MARRADSFANQVRGTDSTGSQAGPSKPQRTDSMASQASDSSSRSNASSRSANGSRRDHELNVNFYHRDTTGHWGAMIHQENATRGNLHHVTSQPNYDAVRIFQYTPEDKRVFSPTLHGKSRVARMSAGEFARMDASMRRYGNKEDHLPREELGENCQDFVTGMLGALEEEKLIAPGNRDFFHQQRRKNGKEIEAAVKQDGRNWVGKRAEDDFQGTADATYGARQRPEAPGKTNKAKFESLLGRRLPANPRP